MDTLLDKSLYTEQEQFLNYCESKIEVHVDFNFNPSINPNVRMLLFGNDNVLLKTPKKSLQHQTLALAIYINILENYKIDVMNEKLLDYGSILIFNALFNIPFREYEPMFVSSYQNIEELKNEYYKNERYSLKNTPESKNLNAIHMAQDFKHLIAKSIKINQSDILAAIYGLSTEHQIMLIDHESCFAFISNFILNDANLYKYFSKTRYNRIFHYKPITMSLDLNEHTMFLIREIHNSTFLNTITNDVNRYQYTQIITKDRKTNVFSIGHKSIYIFNNIEDHIKQIGINQEISNLLYGVMMTYDFENGKLNNMILVDNVKVAVSFADNYQHGMVIVFYKEALPPCTNADRRGQIEFRKFNKFRGNNIPYNIQCYTYTTLDNDTYYYVVDTDFFKIDYVYSIIYNNRNC